MSELDFSKYQILTFDCYGTIIDWETGISKSLTQILDRHNIDLDRESILNLHAEFEPEIQAGQYLTYRETLKRVVDSFGSKLDFQPSEADRSALAESIAEWPPFPDSQVALKQLQKHFELAVISNIDNDLFSYSQRKVGINFDYLITAQQVRAYKPSLKLFEAALVAIPEPKGRILHVAQSLFHDIEPANRFGLDSVWVNRRQNQSGGGATPPSDAKAKLEVASLEELALLVEQSF